MCAYLRSMPKITCKHFKQCGGCALLDLSYEEQVARKSTRLREILKDFWTDEIPVTLTDKPEFFRNKVELGFCRQPIWKEPFDKKVKRDKTLPLEFEQCFGFKLKGRSHYDTAIHGWFEK